MLMIVVNRCNQRDARLVAESQEAIVHVTDGDHEESGINARLRILLELETILCMEYRYVQLFTVALVLGFDNLPPPKECVLHHHKPHWTSGIQFRGGLSPPARWCS